MKRVWILRLGHRVPRDSRVSTHLAMTARAFGAERLIYSGDRDIDFEEKILSLASKWGGNFHISYVNNPINLIKELKKDFRIIHLTMYGVNLPDIVEKIIPIDNILVIVGGKKVPGIYYQLSDYNIAVGNQPHSEIAALAVFLDWIYMGMELQISPSPSQSVIIPSKSKKFVVHGNKENW